MNLIKINRRNFLRSASMLAALPFIRPASTYGIAYTSFLLLLRQRRASSRPFDAFEMIETCRDLGAGGFQIDIAQLTSADSGYLKKIREAAGFIELAVSARILEDEAGLEKVAATAGALGVTRLRVACLSGRRYENFDDMSSWRAFAERWKKAIRTAEPLLRKYHLTVGVENHKDWTADEMAEIMRSIDSPHLGVCLDFGNNMALLEDPLETTQKLAPFAVTTHLKDMAVKTNADGFELSEVPLGRGILPLARMIEILRKHRSDIRFCLEMITRDPLRVPYKTEKFWVTYNRRDEERIARFERTILNRSSNQPLPRITGRGDADALDIEMQNVIECSRYAINKLKL
ncbi:MAG: sugar phosphate isomerase/epimerase [Acidobacteriota bacterium]|nr:MAG: sugar phosphate isomerase/epimerase [Acidobacteriota bacterium]